MHYDGQQWPESRASSRRASNASSIGMEEGGAENHQPRVRDRQKKMRVPCFGLVYKRQMLVNTIMLLLLVAYIALVVLV